MTGKKLAKGFLGMTAGALAIAAASSASAQSYADFQAGCVGTANVACIAQIGDGNNVSIDQVGATKSRATVYIRGDNNGTGTIAGVGPVALSKVYRSGAGLDLDNDGVPGYMDGNDLKKSVGATAAGSLTMQRDLPSGVVIQRGANNKAAVYIVGDQNDFHVSQLSGNNSAEQTILGNGNAAIALQGGADTASQTVTGSNNLSYVSQSGGNNWAKTFQTASSSEILLEQKNGNNAADLSQVGSDNSIALRQTGGVSASISQFGSGKSIAVEQSAGFLSSAIVITQF